MFEYGVIVNFSTIIVGSVLGALVNRSIKDEYEVALFNALGLAMLGNGIAHTTRYMPQSEYPVLFIFALALGSIIGAKFKIERSILNKGKKYISRHRKSEGVLLASFIFTTSTLSIIGPIHGAAIDNNIFLYNNAALDFFFSFIFAANYGISIILSAFIVLLFQGLIYIITHVLSDRISMELLIELGVVGGLIIISGGITTLKIKDLKPLNRMPSILIVILFFLFIEIKQEVFL